MTNNQIKISNARHKARMSIIGIKEQILNCTILADTEFEKKRLEIASKLLLSLDDILRDDAWRIDGEVKIAVEFSSTTQMELL